MAKILPRVVDSPSMSSYLVTHASTGGRKLKRNIAHNKHGMLHAYSSPSSAKGDNNYVSPYTAQPILSTSATPVASDLHNKTIQAQILAAERERIRAEFFATYDVMTGVRIAATLGGFFGLMVFLIVWKSRSSSNETLKVLKDPKMAAVAAVCMQEEEEREIQEAMVATGMSIFPDECDAILYRRQRMLSLGNVSAPPMLNRGFRFSSIGGGGPVLTSLNTRPRRFSYSASSAADSLCSGKRKKSVSESSRVLDNFPMGSSFGTNDLFIEADDDIEDASYIINTEGKTKSQTQRPVRSDSTHSKGALLDVPILGQDSRRSSSMTCCSTESSYLERRCSALTLGLSNFPGALQRKLSNISHTTSSTDNWDYIYPDIQIINATPKPSPQTTTVTTPMQVIRKQQSIAYCDPDKPQVGRCQQPHSISAKIFDSYACNKNNNKNQQLPSQRTLIGVHQGFHSFDIAVEERRRQISLIEVQEPNDEGFIPMVDFQQQQQRISATNTAYENNNNHTFPCQEVVKTNSIGGGGEGDAGNSSSISMDSTPLSIDQLNGSSSLGIVSVKALFNAEKRAPLASLSSFKISSMEYADSHLQTRPNEDSVFGLKSSGCDTDDDMQDLSSDSEEVSFPRNTRKDKQRNLVEPKPTVIALLQRQRSISATSSDRENLLQSLRPTKKRAILMQQHSDPKSLPTTTYTEEDTCSTLNTELCGTNDNTGGGGGGGESSNTTLTQYSSLNTVVSFGKLSPTQDAQNQCNQSDSIFMPNALKDVILRGSLTQTQDKKLPKIVAQQNKSHSSTNLLDTSMEVRLELPLIKLSVGKSSDSSLTPSESDERKSCDASIPSSSTKWSKETLF